MDTIKENADIIISIIALVVALVSPIYSYIMTKKVNDINLQSDYLKDIYKTYLTKEIPNARKFISFNDNILKNTEPLQKAILGLKKDLYFLKYSDAEFYESIKLEIQTLENYIVENEGAVIDDKIQSLPSERIEHMLVNIYETLNDKYKNG